MQDPKPHTGTPGPLGYVLCDDLHCQPCARFRRGQQAGRVMAEATLRSMLRRPVGPATASA